MQGCRRADAARCRICASAKVFTYRVTCMKLRPETALTFDDVLLIPKRSSIRSRHAVNTRTLFSRRLALALPIVSANMDTVTESAMALALARMGGLGVIHRFMTVERQAAEVERVKRAEGFMVEEPHNIPGDATVQEARAMLLEYEIGGLLVCGKDGEVVGLVTTRDLLFEADPNRPVAEVMTPRDKLVTTEPGGSDRKSTRLNSSHVAISYAVFCLTKKKKKQIRMTAEKYIKKTQRPPSHTNKH